VSDVVIVTGAASGLGAVYCRELAAAGYTVVGADLAPEPPEQGLKHIGVLLAAVPVNLVEKLGCADDLARLQRKAA